MHPLNRDLGFSVAIHVVKKRANSLVGSSVGQKMVCCEWAGESPFPVVCCWWKDSGLGKLECWSGFAIWNILLHKKSVWKTCSFTNTVRAQFVTRAPECLRTLIVMVLSTMLFPRSQNSKDHIAALNPQRQVENPNHDGQHRQSDAHNSLLLVLTN